MRYESTPERMFQTISGGPMISQVVLVAFGLQTGADRKSLVSCAMRLVTLTVSDPLSYRRQQPIMM
jgi:hypothetical protein